MATAIALKWLLAVLNPYGASRRALLIGLLVPFGVVVLLQLALQTALNRPLFDLGGATYLFWFGLPGLVYIGASGLGALWLNRQLASGANRSTHAARPSMAEQRV
jgi:hypothetical protein